MRAHWLTAGLILVLTTAMTAGPAFAQHEMPYFGSIASGKARMRVGPGREYPSSWIYQRADLPVKIVEVYRGWKKIEDPAGTQGWIQANLLSDARTGLVLRQVVELRDTPRPAGRVQWRAEPGVVGRISKCARGWCYFDVRGRGGYVESDQLWGVDPVETLN